LQLCSSDAGLKARRYEKHGLGILLVAPPAISALAYSCGRQSRQGRRRYNCPYS
jgi:hypothetical protein